MRTPTGDDAAFAARVARLDPEALVLAREGLLWAALPIGVLAVRDASAAAVPDGVYRAGDLASGAVLARADAWRGRLPQRPWTTIETVPAADIAELDRKAAAALRERRGQGIGDRRLRDALLDHVALRVERGDGDALDGGSGLSVARGVEHRIAYQVEQRLVTALCRMGFLGEEPVRVLASGRRVGLAGTYGAVWDRDRGLPLL